MSRTVLTLGVAVITLTAKVYEGRTTTTYSTRIGFCGEFNKQILQEIAKHLKKDYENQSRTEFKNADKITCRATIKTTGCDLLLNGGK